MTAARLFWVLVVLASCLPFPPSPAQTAAPALPDNIERARAVFSEGLESRDFAIRKEAITAMSMIGRDEILLTRLPEFLHDKNVEVRLAALHALADFDSPQSQEALRQTMQEEKTPEVSFAAAKVLAGLKNPDPAAVAALMDVYQGKRKTRSGILKQQERSFFEEFHSTESALMFLIGKGVGNVPVPGAGEGFSAIGALLRDSNVSDRASVLLILCRTRNPESLRLLREALHHKDWSVRAVAAQMVAQTAQTALQDSLLPLFDDKNKKVRFRAAGAYLHLIVAIKQGAKTQLDFPHAD